MKNDLLDITVNKADGGLSSVILCNDAEALNWVGGDKTFGTPFALNESFKLLKTTAIENKLQSIYSLGDVEVTCEYVLGAKLLEGSVAFKNKGAKKLFKKGDLGFCTCFNDNYEKAEVCLTKRCHSHIWIADDTAYIMARRMNGGDNNLALLVTEGNMGGYAVTRRENSNDRGDFYLLLNDIELDTDKSVNVKFVLMPYKDSADFYKKAAKYRSFCNITADNFTINKGDKLKLNIATQEQPVVISGGVETVASGDKGAYVAEITPPEGESKVIVKYGKYQTFAEVNYIDINEIIDKRLNFLIDKQQCFDTKSPFYGAYFLFDRETGKTFVENKPVNDRNIGRERSGIICAMITRVLRGGLSEEMENKYRYSINHAMRFIDNNLVKPNGQICDAPKYKRNVFFERLYNYSMFMLVYSLMYELTADEYYIKKAGTIARKYYAKGGDHFYAINLPFCAVYEQTKRAGLDEDAEELKKLFLAHGDRIVSIGSNFPPHEVKYEQSIVAPSVDILLECYKLSGGEKRYIDEAKNQMKLLEAFCGQQPSCHQYEIPIRHWDGFWFGKRKLYGDTFPHYWSCINAAAYCKYAAITEDESYKKRARKVLENALCLFDDEGNGSCAYLYPDFVNGTKGKFYDPWENDQDWAIYFFNTHY